MLQRVQNNAVTNALRESRPVQKKVHTKTNYTKTKTKELTAHADVLQTIIEEIKNTMRL
jgi:hypothetical protein